MFLFCKHFRNGIVTLFHMYFDKSYFPFQENWLWKIDNILKYSSGTRICIFYYFSLKCFPVVSCIFKEHFKPYLKNILSEKLLNSDLVFKNLLCTCMLTSASQSNTPCSYCLLHFFNNISNTIFEKKNAVNLTSEKLLSWTYFNLKRCSLQQTSQWTNKIHLLKM